MKQQTSEQAVKSISNIEMTTSQLATDNEVCKSKLENISGSQQKMDIENLKDGQAQSYANQNILYMQNNVIRGKVNQIEANWKWE